MPSSPVIPRVLLLASRFDLTCDFVVSCLRRRSVPYLRLNSEDMNDLEFWLDPVRTHAGIRLTGRDYELRRDALKSVLYRRPVFLRDYGDDKTEPDARFSRIQWAALFRNLMVFDTAMWMNLPSRTYTAEHKAVQLAVAARLGFPVPETRITNAPSSRELPQGTEVVAVKGLDTVLLRDRGNESFGFTTFQPTAELHPQAWRSAPATIQAALEPKLDVRVTVIRERVFAAAITTKGCGLTGDWRTHKGEVEFKPYDLPQPINDLCVSLVSRLGLTFGAIDLAYSSGAYYFLEINPTGEWAWLVDATGLPIDEAVADALCN